MKSTNSLIYIGFIIHVSITLIAGLDEEFILYFMSVPLLGNFVGLCLLTFTDKTKLGAQIFMISSFLFVPIGLIGIFGCRKVLDSINEEAFFKSDNKKTEEPYITKIND